MKILFYISKSIESRIVMWGLENMRALLEEDIVFFGPIKEKFFSFENKDIPIISFNEEIKTAEIFNQLPSGWFPDIVCCDVSSLLFIPDIYKCPSKTLLLARDTWGDVMFNPGIVSFFDFVRCGTIDRPQYADKDSVLLPLLGAPAAFPEKRTLIPTLTSRKIDVLSVANYNPRFYHDRYKTFYLLSRDNPGIRIKILKNLMRNQLQKHYLNSKIVLDWSHTLSNRSYEAALNGCLLFSNEENSLIGNFWKPWKEYIPYNHQNLRDLIRYYLEHHDEAQNIADTIRKKMLHVPNTFGGSIVKHCTYVVKTEVNIHERIQRISTLDKGLFYHRISTGFYYNYNYLKESPKNWEQLYLSRIDKAIEFGGSKEITINILIEATKLSFLLNRFDISLNYADKLQHVLPEYAWTYYLRGRIYFTKKEFDAAYQEVHMAIKCCKDSSKLLNTYYLPFAEKNNVCDARRIKDYAWRFALNQNEVSQAKFLLCMSFELLGDISIIKGNVNDAAYNYLQSLKAIPTPACAYKAFFILMKTKEYTLALEQLNIVVEDLPYDTLIVYYQYLTLFGLGKIKDGRRKLIQHFKALKAFKNSPLEVMQKVFILAVIACAFFRIKLECGMLYNVLFKIHKISWFLSLYKSAIKK